MKPIIAIVGRPNVGKSTLFNRIVGRRKAITLDVSGVTRDRHYGHASWEGRDFVVIDTGGFPLGDSDSLENKIKAQIELAIREASLIFFVMDGRSGLLPEDREIVKKLRRSSKKTLFVVNKVDGPKQEEKMTEFYELGEEIHVLSAEHGYRVNDLLDRAITYLPLTVEEPTASAIRIALIGRPNVGKSSLLNRLLGEERVVVHDQPGTTRDAIDTHLQVDNKEYLLVDTAGIRRGAKSASKVERYSVLNALKAIERADLCLLLLDAKEGIHKQDAHVSGYASEAKKPLLFLWNKWDLIGDSKEHRREFISTFQDRFRFISYAPITFVSAKTGFGCSGLWSSVRHLYESSGKKVPTHHANEVLQKLVDSHNPPVYKGKPVKFFYMTQIDTLPPIFLIFVNEPKGVHFSFQRYLVNGLREAFGFEGSPVEVYFRKKM